MARKIVDVAVIIPDASPVLTLARIDRLGTARVKSTWISETAKMKPPAP